MSAVRQINPEMANLLLVPVAILLCWHLLNFFKLYDAFRTKQDSKVTGIMINTFLFQTVLFGAMAYISSRYILAKSFFIFFVLLIGALLIEFLVLSVFFRRMRKQGLRQNVLVVGSGPRAKNFLESVNQHEEWGLNIVGILDGDDKKVGESVMGHKILGTLKDAPDIIHNNIVDEIVFLVPKMWLTKIEELVDFCETEGVRINLAVDHFNLKIAKTQSVNFYGLPMVNCSSDPAMSWHLGLKRLMDIVLSGLALIVFMPLMLLIALAIRLTSEGPVLFTQQRCSLHHRKFAFYKFRTMGVDAESKLAALQKNNEMKGPAFKMTNDPRVTRLGKFLRKTSLDELPQLWNVFRGDMSIVGPRPPIPNEVNRYDSWHRRRLSMRPGLTCLWQISGRNQIVDFDQWMKLDLSYIDRWSIWLDLEIIFKTVPAVLFAKGAK